MRCQKNTATTFCLGCGRQAFCDLCQRFSHDGREVDGYGPPGNLSVNDRDRNGRGRAGPPGNCLASEDLLGCGGFPGRNPRDFEFGTPVNFVGRVPRDFEGEEFSPKERDLDKTMMLRDHNGGKKYPRPGYQITGRPSWSFHKVWYVCLPWY
jgi:hypothetical protein